MTEPHYPHNLNHLARFISQPLFSFAFCWFLFNHYHPDSEQVPANIKDLPSFEGEIKVYHSAIATYYASSDLCRGGGLQHEFIWSTPSFRGHECRDTVFVVLDKSKKGMEGMEIVHVLLFYSFQYHWQNFSCALINWFVHDDEPNHDTGMWTVQMEYDRHGQPPVEVIDVNSIAWGAHLLLVYSSSQVPVNFSHHDALDSFNSFFVNHYWSPCSQIYNSDLDFFFYCILV